MSADEIFRIKFFDYFRLGSSKIRRQVPDVVVGRFDSRKSWSTESDDE